MQRPPTLAGEAERLAKLASYGVLDTQAEQSFDDLARLAALVCDTPISAVSLIDSQRQWFKAVVGLEAASTRRDVSFCGHTIAGPGPLVVPDTLADPRFHDNPFVISEPKIRFYAGTPLVAPDGSVLGALCVIDRRPRTLSAEQVAALERLGRQCMQLLELRLTNARLTSALAERQTAAASLQASEAHVAAVTQSAVDAIVSANAQGKIISWNAGAERIFGFSRAEIIGQPLTVIMPERYRAAHAHGLARMAETGHTTLTEKTFVLEGLRKDGTVFDLELSLGSWSTTEGRFFSGIMRDVTTRRQATEAMRNERDFIAAVLDASDALIIVLAPDGSITRFNDACERATGYSAREVLGRCFDFLLPGEESVGVAEAFIHLTAGALRGRYENHWMHKDGSKRLIAWSNAVLTDDEGAVAHVIGTGIDITERRKAETDLGRQGAIMGSVLKNMSDSVLVTDERGDFVLFNAAAERMLGRSPTDGPPEAWPKTYGMYLPDCQTRLDPSQTPMARALRGEHVDQFEIFMRTPQFPEGRWHSVTSSPVTDAASAIIGTINVGRDITERKQAEATLTQHAAELRALALRDELTGLNNRRGFMLLSAQQLRQSTRMQRPALLVFIDLDGMKPINDRFGHEEGDRALRDTAAILMKVFRESDIVARLGGDEFVVLITDAGEPVLPIIRNRLDAALRAHNLREGQPYELAMSLGSTCYDPAAPRPIEALLASADAVMYAQKQARRLLGLANLSQDPPPTGHAKETLA